MAAESWDSSAAVTAQESGKDDRPEFRNLRKLLDEEPFRVHFFQAVRMLQRMEQDRKPVGYFITPQGETIRFSARTSLAFPPSELYELRRMENGQMSMTVEFMGLCAAISVMPAPYTEFLIARAREKDHAMEDFLNIFNHRMISFFYRGWEKYRFFIEYEKSREDRLSGRLLDLLGLGTEGLRERGGIPDDAYLNYVGLLARHVRSAASLQQILEDYFGVQVHIQQFAGAWRKLNPENQTCFTGFGGANERLGVGVVAGDEVWDHHGRIRVSLGPMRFGQYLKFLPRQDAYNELVAWLKFYSNGSYETEVQLVLARDDAPSCELGSGGEKRPQLGLVSWLKTKPLDRDPADATYLVQ
ncbi:MAG TPA: type VI secretion system baseplate subunit TssG [Terracidiphilus sp.]|nr:type VI secretion system baseplate subunit TssG [Terracidiphilus sp.]